MHVSENSTIRGTRCACGKKISQFAIDYLFRAWLFHTILKLFRVYYFRQLAPTVPQCNQFHIVCSVFFSSLSLILFPLCDVEWSLLPLLLPHTITLAQLDVVGSNLTGACKLVFKVARNEKNDNLFASIDVPGKCKWILLETT